MPRAGLKTTESRSSNLLGHGKPDSVARFLQEREGPIEESIEKDGRISLVDYIADAAKLKIV